MGNRFFDENCERILNGQKRRYRRHRAKLCSTRGRCPERPRRRRNPDWYTGKRATTGRARGAPVRKARILGSMGVRGSGLVLARFWRPWWPLARGERPPRRSEKVRWRGNFAACREWRVVDFCGQERCGARGLAHREAGGEEEGGDWVY